EQALDAAVLAPPAMERDERDLDLLLAQGDVEVAVDVDRNRVVAALAQRREHRLSAAQRHLALAGQTAEHHTDLARLHLGNLLALDRAKRRLAADENARPSACHSDAKRPHRSGQFFRPPHTGGVAALTQLRGAR